MPWRSSPPVTDRLWDFAIYQKMKGILGVRGNIRRLREISHIRLDAENLKKVIWDALGDLYQLIWS